MNNAPAEIRHTTFPEMTPVELEALVEEIGLQNATAATVNIADMEAAEFLIAREAIGTQADVADAMGRPRRTIGRWERGERAVPAAARVWIRREVRKAQERKAKTLEDAKAMEASNGE